MKQFILEGALLLAAVACADATSPRPSGSPGTLPAVRVSNARVPVSTNLFAVVDGESLTAGNGVSTVEFTGFGYEVTFTRDVTHCAYVATSTNAYGEALTVFTANGRYSSHGVYVQIKNQGGGLEEGRFHLVVTCGDPGTMFAVVGYTANLVRATRGTTMVSQGNGEYMITFPFSVRECALIATVGDPGAGKVYSPSLVFTSDVSTSDEEVHIATKNLAGQAQNGVPFHLALICNNATESRFAVVNGKGSLARGSGGTTTSSSTTGHFSVAMDRRIDVCATVATRGTTTQKPTFQLATVEVVPGATSNAVDIEMRSLLSAGGNFISEQFHMATVC